VLWMTERQDEELARLGLPFGGLWGRPLHAIDCQGLFCETDKYSRVAFPELTSNRVRIKQEYRFAGPLAPLQLPPKWGYATSQAPNHNSAGVAKAPSRRRPSARPAQAVLALQ
jgi:hypothetical protein